jgi:hypothetical protein
MLFILPGICSAFNMILYCKDSKIRFLTRVIMKFQTIYGKFGARTEFTY